MNSESARVAETGVDATTQGFADDHHVGPDVFPIRAEEPPGSAEAGLDLVGHQGDPPLGAELPGHPQVAVGRNDHSALTLDGLDEEADCLVSHRLAKRVAVTVRDELEARRERSEAFAVLRLGREADNCRSPAVEVVLATR